MDLAASMQAVLEEVVLRLTRSLAARDRRAEPLPGGRRGAELRRQRQGAARRASFENIWIQPAAGDAGGALGAALAAALPVQGNAARGRRRRCACAAPIWARSSRRPKSKRGFAAAGARFAAMSEAELLERLRGRARTGAGGGLVPGAHGVRAARAGRAVDPGRCAVAAHAVDSEPEGQVPRIVPAVRAFGAAGARCRLVRARPRRAPTCCWWRMWRGAGGWP